MEIWKLIQEQSPIMNPRKRRSTIQEIQRKIMDDFQDVFLYTQTRFNINKPYVHVTKQYLYEFQNLYGEFHLDGKALTIVHRTFVMATVCVLLWISKELGGSHE